MFDYIVLLATYSTEKNPAMIPCAEDVIEASDRTRSGHTSYTHDVKQKKTQYSCLINTFHFILYLLFDAIFLN